MLSFKFLRSVILFLFLSASLSSCFSRYIISAKQVRKHYALKKVKPTEQIIKNDTLSLCIASVGADTLPMLLAYSRSTGFAYGAI
jgi:ABC-type uncharacterized transport system auxiliary subunit